MKHIYLLLAILLTLPACAQSRFGDVDFEQIKKLQMAQVAITSLYVDSVDQKKLAEDAINGMLSKLDPHSSYTNAKDTKKLNEPLSGNFEGIGVSFNMVKDTLVVLQVISKGIGLVLGRCGFGVELHHFIQPKRQTRQNQQKEKRHQCVDIFKRHY